MVKFKLVVSSLDGRATTLDIESMKAQSFIGKKIGDSIDGSIIGLANKTLLITGGSDRDGFPMRPDVHGGIRSSILINRGIGFHADLKGERKRKTIRGNTITSNIIQINTKIVEKKKRKK